MIVEHPESSGQIVVTDRRKNYDGEAESNAAQVEPTPELIGPPAPASDPGPGPYIDEGPQPQPEQEAPKPITEKDYPTLYVPSLIDGQQIKFRVGELLPWKGVFFIVAEVKPEPVPHMLLFPVDHTKAHKKIAAKSKQHAPRKKRIGGVTGS